MGVGQKKMTCTYFVLCIFQDVKKEVCYPKTTQNDPFLLPIR